MSEQAKILSELQEIIMNILKNGAATAEEGHRIDTLEALLQEQKSYTKIEHPTFEYLGEEIADLFATGKMDEGIKKLHASDISVTDFFDFIEYHDEDEDYVEIFTPAFIADVTKRY